MPNMLQHDRKQVEQLECPTQNPDLNPNEHLQDELELQMHPRPSHTLVPEITNALVTVTVRLLEKIFLKDFPEELNKQINQSINQ